MISKYAPKRENRLINENDIHEELRLISRTDDYYITPTGRIYRKYSSGFYPRTPNYVKTAGYYYITLVIKSGKKKTFRIHRLVAETYIPNPHGYPIVGHKDNNKTNNSVDNLYWTTNKENIQKAVNDGLLINDRGAQDSQSRSVICFDEYYNELYRFGSVSEGHRELGVSKSTIIRHCEHEILTKTRCGYYFEYEDRNSNDYRKL